MILLADATCVHSIFPPLLSLPPSPVSNARRAKVWVQRRDRRSCRRVEEEEVVVEEQEEGVSRGRAQGGVLSFLLILERVLSYDNII